MNLSQKIRHHVFFLRHSVYKQDTKMCSHNLLRNFPRKQSTVTILQPS